MQLILKLVSRAKSKKEFLIGQIAVVILGLVFMMAGASNLTAAEKTTEQLLNEAKALVKNFSVHEVKKMIDGKQETVILDIRDMKGFVVEHLQGAQNMSRAVNLSPRLLEHHMRKTVPDKNARIIVYCEFDTRAPLAVKAMNEIGYTNAVYMLGGLKAWKETGYPLEK